MSEADSTILLIVFVIVFMVLLLLVGSLTEGELTRRDPDLPPLIKSEKVSRDRRRR